MRTAINFTEKFSKSSEHWSPNIIAQMNDYHFKLVKSQGDFVWHDLKYTDEAFVVLEGEMTIHFRNDDVSVRVSVFLSCPRYGLILMAPWETQMMSIAAVLNTKWVFWVLPRARSTSGKTGNAGASFWANPTAAWPKCSR